MIINVVQCFNREATLVSPAVACHEPMSRTGGRSMMSDRDVKGGRYAHTLSMITPRGGRKGGGCDRS
jgi:hypothetical protein